MSALLYICVKMQLSAGKKTLSAWFVSQELKTAAKPKIDKYISDRKQVSNSRSVGFNEGPENLFSQSDRYYEKQGST